MRTTTHGLRTTTKTSTKTKEKKTNPDAQVNIRNASNAVLTFEGQIQEAAAAPLPYPTIRPQLTTNTATPILTKASLHAMTAGTFETSQASITQKKI
jgi:hypothetical protein